MPVFLVPWDASWPAQFAAERERLLAALPPVLGIEHIGSTAIPGMDAKPVIDIMVLVAKISEHVRYLVELDTLDYRYLPYDEDRSPGRRFHFKPSLRHRTHHLHLVEAPSDYCDRHLLFRDHLRADADDARRYLELKRALAARHPDDREAYTNGKTALILEILERAARLPGRPPDPAAPP